MSKDYVKFEMEIFFDKDGSYCKKLRLLDKGVLSEEFLDELWDNDSIGESVLK